MAEDTSAAFLSGQGIPVEPGQIEAELIRLWGPAAERAGGPDLENPNVTRIVLANLVVEAGPDCPDRLEATLDTVVARHPCRSIVLRRTDEPGRKVGAEVAALCHMPSGDRPQVCSERIVLRAGPEALDLLPGAVRPLLEANLPFVLWWTGDPRPVAGAVPRPRRRMLPAPARPARPRLRARSPPAGPRPGHQPVDPRRGLVRDHPLARAGGPVLRRPRRGRGPRADRRRRGPGRGAGRAQGPPGRRLARRLARRPARLGPGGSVVADAPTGVDVSFRAPDGREVAATIRAEASAAAGTPADPRASP